MKRAALLGVLFAAGCGGGGGSSSPPSPPPPPPPPPAPTVSLSASASTFYQGDPATLTWTSANTTSCTASDAWTGSLATSGSHVVTVPAIASATWTITCTGPGGSASASATASASEKPFFVEIPDALIATLPPNTAASVVVVPLDVNGDGRDDLVFHYYGGHHNQSVGGIPCNNGVRVYIHQADHTFADETATWLPGGADLGGGCSRKSRVADINNDGKPDIVYALNREDGRQNATLDETSNQMGAFLSIGSTWSLQMFGPIDWYHSIGTGILPDGRAFVTGDGFGPAEAGAWVLDANGVATLDSQVLPSVSPNTFQFLSSTGVAGAKSDLMIQTGIYPNLLGIEGHYLDGANVWQSAGIIPIPFPQVGTVDFYTYTGEGPFPTPVHDVGGAYIVGAGSGSAISESCLLRINPGDPPVLAMKMDMPFVNAYAPGVTTVVYQGDANNPSDLTPGQQIVGARIVNNQIESVPIVIDDEQRLSVNANFLSCKDVNADGYDDIIVHPYSSTGRPHVYLNDRAGGFAFIGLSQYPVIPDAWGNAPSSILHDFDRDGFTDLLIWPSNGIVTTDPVAFRYYRGLKHLE